jgi:virulence-associated protein VapD
MFKMEITMNEDKVLQDRTYNLTDIYSTIDKKLERYHIKKVEDGVYVGTGSQHDFALFGKAILDLKNKEWFLPYVAKWLLYDGKSVEDVAEHYRGKSKVRM